MSSEKRGEQDLSTEVGTKSRTDVLAGMDDRILKTCDVVTGWSSLQSGVMTDGVGWRWRKGGNMSCNERLE